MPCCLSDKAALQEELLHVFSASKVRSVELIKYGIEILLKLGNLLKLMYISPLLLHYFCTDIWQTEKPVFWVLTGEPRPGAAFVPTRTWISLAFSGALSLSSPPGCGQMSYRFLERSTISNLPS